jgi:hypothetical protein
MGSETLDKRVFQLSAEQVDQAFLPDAGVGRWPIRVLLGHLADAELAFVHRMRRVVGEDSPVFSVWDENSFIDANIYGCAPADRPMGEGRCAAVWTHRSVYRGHPHVAAVDEPVVVELERGAVAADGDAPRCAAR